MVSSSSYTDQEVVFGSVMGVLASFGIMCSITTMHLIFKLKRWNGYMLVVFALSASQAFFDCSFFVLPGFRTLLGRCLFAFVFTAGGTAVTLWTNVISVVIFYIVKYRATIELQRNFPLLATTVFLLSIAIGGAQVGIYLAFGSPSPTFYISNCLFYGFRLGSIVLNLWVHCAVHIRMWRMGLYRQAVNGQPIGREGNPLYVLIGRLKYYPLVQILTRAGGAWWELQYGFSYQSYDEGQYDSTKTVAAWLYSISSPSAGIGYFLVFLAVQPVAYAYVKRYLQTCGLGNEHRKSTDSSKVSLYLNDESLSSTEQRSDQFRSLHSDTTVSNNISTIHTGSAASYPTCRMDQNTARSLGIPQYTTPSKCSSDTGLLSEVLLPQESGGTCTTQPLSGAPVRAQMNNADEDFLVRMLVAAAMGGSLDSAPERVEFQVENSQAIHSSSNECESCISESSVNTFHTE